MILIFPRITSQKGDNMRTAVLRAAEKIDIIDMDLGPPGVGQVLLDVIACGICGSNLHDWEQPHPANVGSAGAFGHEISAVVSQLGDDVSGISVGDHVAVHPSKIGGCQKCAPCQEGAAWFCEAKVPVPTFGFAEQMVSPVHALTKMPSALPIELGALVEPVACGVHAMRHSWTARENGRVDGVHVVVLGAGMLGLSAVIAARDLGASYITVVAKHEHQKQAAMAVGADEIVDSTRDDASSVLRKMRSPLVVEAVGGGANTLDLATEIVARRGEVVVLGAFTQPMPVNVGRMLNRDQRMFCAVAYSARDGVDDFDYAATLVAQKADCLAPLASHSVPLENIEEGFRIAMDKSSGAIRVLVTAS
jgi:(R,R)-butanediol dehydrogenase / meso-butanediol dehydrogenase / diacetyl reductase